MHHLKPHSTLSSNFSQRYYASNIQNKYMYIILISSARTLDGQSGIFHSSDSYIFNISVIDTPRTSNQTCDPFHIAHTISLSFK